MGTQSESLCLFEISGDTFAPLCPRQGAPMASRECPWHPSFIPFERLTGRVICPLPAFICIAVLLPGGVTVLGVNPTPGRADPGLTLPLTGLCTACVPRATAFLICLLIRAESPGVTFLTITCVQGQVSPSGGWSCGEKAAVYMGRGDLTSFAPRTACSRGPAVPPPTLALSESTAFIMSLCRFTHRVTLLLGNRGQCTCLPAHPGQPGAGSWRFALGRPGPLLAGWPCAS